MEKWAYLTEFVTANIEKQGVREFLKEKMPGFRPDRYSPETMIPELNNRGKDGWELIHMQPVLVGKNSDILQFNYNSTQWTNWYFCVYKRKIE